ncbi:MAG: Malate dehydrogenase (Oxaloacetate-decarboxylating) [Candidatus Magasanikbacteria bacterium GW2011_GWC2_34_16]|uniref:Malate dehydrogenase (Oxaloacetate-decarboxylating) n=2 Tax=Candidatus Magasanikiibacteriota TaxID=1752731 RepID=A0A0G0HMG7_9BACT|nr:MAG: Malate dehydrogenase (Oxaloacetate-decarboxylating) [Candidatus Magasanikbacteria bacterium GW2011_GWC2_34_16]KKQ39745.1 MAG: Malate dehydrogenase (Oxaloacetate-decarboxylating) [Candidatus Magasanikbacteria bacterium GW2011_GWA2_37_8]
MDYREDSLKRHLQFKGKIEIRNKFPEIKTKDDLSIAYTPGIAAVSLLLAENPSKSYDYSIKGNTVAVISDGSAVLGLGNIGPYGALPVMEGKALLFKEFGGVDAYPIVLATQNVEEIIQTIKAIAPTFGGINLEDISAPRCFEIEERLIKELDIPVFHDDQHGTSVVILAALINSLKLADKKPENVKVVVSGAGAAAIATAKLLIKYGIKNIILVDSQGIVSKQRVDLNEAKTKMLAITNLENIDGNLEQALIGADIFIGVSAPGILKAEFIKVMSEKPIIFAMSNPIPEIMPDLAKDNGAFIVGTGRSDFSNQINNVLVFPGLFRGLLDNRIKIVTDEIKIAAAETLAGYLSENELTTDNILPSVLDKNIAKAIAIKLADFKV